MRKSDKTPMVEPKVSVSEPKKYSRFTETFTTFTGTAFTTTPDMGKIEGISYTIHREQTPIFTMGSPKPRQFTRGKRAIVGSIKFVDPPADHKVFDLKISCQSDAGTFSKTLYGLELGTILDGVHAFSAREIGPMK